MQLRSYAPAGNNECVEWHVSVDGAAIGNTPANCYNHASPLTLTVLNNGIPASILPGVHQVKILAVFSSGPAWANTYLDYFDLVA